MSTFISSGARTVAWGACTPEGRPPGTTSRRSHERSRPGRGPHEMSLLLPAADPRENGLRHPLDARASSRGRFMTVGASALNDRCSPYSPGGSNAMLKLITHAHPDDQPPRRARPDHGAPCRRRRRELRAARPASMVVRCSRSRAPLSPQRGRRPRRRAGGAALRLPRHRRGSTPTPSFLTWLHRIVVNRALMRLRTRRRRPEESIDDPLPSFDEQGALAHGVVDWDAGDREPRRAASVTRSDRPPLHRSPARVVSRARDPGRDVEERDTDEAAGAPRPHGLRREEPLLHRASPALRELAGRGARHGCGGRARRRLTMSARGRRWETPTRGW